MDDLNNTYIREKERAAKYGQENIFRFWDELSHHQKERLLQAVQVIDYELMDSLYKKCLLPKSIDNYEDMKRPSYVNRYPFISGHNKAMIIGEQAIKNGELGLFVPAGGQGSRLGFNGPKGLYPATPIANKSLFQVFAEKILAAQARYSVKLHWFIMTSDDNHIKTLSFFDDNDYFGLDKDKVHFFLQVGALPALDKQGRILMKSIYEPFFSPNGTGGIYASLAKSGMFEIMKDNNIRYLSFSNVDNSLVKFVDPLFLGYHLIEGSEMSIKVLEKRSSDEPLGAVIDNGGNIRIVEYVGLSKDDSEKKNAFGELIFGLGSINIFIMNVEYIERIYHQNCIDFSSAALKKVPHVNYTGEHVIPDIPNAYKFEAFIFDALPHAKKSFIFKVSREEEFAPIKNPHGEDSPEVAYRMQTELFKKWLLYAGISKEIVVRLKKVEISPLFAMDMDEFKDKISRDIVGYTSKLQSAEEYYFE